MKPSLSGLFALFLLVMHSFSIAAAVPPAIPLWPHGAPGEKATTEAERDLTTPKDGPVAGKPLIRLGNVTEPSLTVYRAPRGNNTGTAVVVFPGGGYRILALDLEGTEVCEWLNSIGVTAVLVKYRVPEPANVPRYAQPLQDAERAVRLVRAHAGEWQIKADRIGVMGFSAGGHLSAVLSNHQGTATYPKVDSADAGSARPDFTALIYPAYLSVGDHGEELAPEVAVKTHIPATFIVQTEDDHAFVGGTLLYYHALQRAGVPAEMHLFSSGGHGYGLRPAKARVTGWPALMRDWMKERGLL